MEMLFITRLLCMNSWFVILKWDKRKRETVQVIFEGNFSNNASAGPHSETGNLWKHGVLLRVHWVLLSCWEYTGLGIRASGYCGFSTCRNQKRIWSLSAFVPFTVKFNKYLMNASYWVSSMRNNAQNKSGLKLDSTPSSGELGTLLEGLHIWRVERSQCGKGIVSRVGGERRLGQKSSVSNFSDIVTPCGPKERCKTTF